MVFVLVSVDWQEALQASLSVSVEHEPEPPDHFVLMPTQLFEPRRDREHQLRKEVEELMIGTYAHPKCLWKVGVVVAYVVLGQFNV